MKDYTFTEFVSAPLVFPKKVRKDIKLYLSAVALIVLFTQIYAAFTSFISIKSAILVATMLFILMPFVLYMKTVLKRNVEAVKTKQKDTSVKFWLFSKRIFHLLLIIVTYLWLTIILLSASMAIVVR
tara:strand:- start:8374 stop:8754 length:381 start_codon:yes stop_codon:yes gene_type:complete